MSLTEKDTLEARRLAKAMSSGNIPVKAVRAFLERIGQEQRPAQPKRKRGEGKKTKYINHFKSIL